MLLSNPVNLSSTVRGGAAHGQGTYVLRHRKKHTNIEHITTLSLLDDHYFTASHVRLVLSALGCVVKNEELKLFVCVFVCV